MGWTMRVIDKREPEIEHICRDCKSKLAVNISDIRYITYSCMGESDSAYRATCAVCGSEMDIKPSAIPYGWQAQIQARRKA